MNREQDPKPERTLEEDTFCGSGTALIAAKELGRKYIGIDAVRAYCDMAEARLKETKVVVKLTSF